MKAKFVKESVNQNEIYISFDYSGKILEMANIYPEDSKLDRVVIWCGPKDPRHGHRVKVSNVPDTFDQNNCFIILIPSLKIYFFPKKSFISSKLLNSIKDFVQKWQDDFIDLSNQFISNKDIINFIKIDKPKKIRLQKENNEQIFEYNSRMSYNELCDMISMSGEIIGFPEITIWIGQNPENIKDKRVKISNVPNKYDGKDCFEISIPNLKIKGNINKNFITDEKMKKLIKFIKINMNLILKYSTSTSLSTSVLLDSLISV